MPCSVALRMRLCSASSARASLDEDITTPAAIATAILTMCDLLTQPDDHATSRLSMRTTICPPRTAPCPDSADRRPHRTRHGDGQTETRLTAEYVGGQRRISRRPPITRSTRG